MISSYWVEAGDLVALKKESVWKYRARRFAAASWRLIWHFALLMGSGLITCFVYQKCIEPTRGSNGINYIPLKESIAIGALFATFGSALVGIFTLSASNHLELFRDNLDILVGDIATDDFSEINWKRWPFLPRLGRLRLFGKNVYSGVNNAYVVFSLEKKSVKFPLPTTQADFGEISVFLNFFFMKLYRRTYLSNLAAKDLLHEYPVWDCMGAIYKNVALYRLDYFGLRIGCIFIFYSILFSFFYPYFFQFIH